MQRRSLFNKAVAGIILASMVAGLFSVMAYADDSVGMAATDSNGNVIGEGSSLTINEPFSVQTEDTSSSGGGDDITASYSFVVAKDIMSSFTKNTDLSNSVNLIYDANVAPMVRWNQPFTKNNSGGWDVVRHDADIVCDVYSEGAVQKSLDPQYLKSDGSIDFDKLKTAPGVTYDSTTGSYSVPASLYTATGASIPVLFFDDINTNAIKYDSAQNAYRAVYAAADLDALSNKILQVEAVPVWVGNVKKAYPNITSDGEIGSTDKYQTSEYFASNDFTVRMAPEVTKPGYYTGTLHLVFSCSHH